jgi:hypothetical protein
MVRCVIPFSIWPLAYLVARLHLKQCTQYCPIHPTHPSSISQCFRNHRYLSPHINLWHVHNHMISLRIFTSACISTTYFFNALSFALLIFSLVPSSIIFSSFHPNLSPSPPSNLCDFQVLPKFRRTSYAFYPMSPCCWVGLFHLALHNVQGESLESVE